MKMHNDVSRSLASKSGLSAEERRAVRASLAIVGVVFAGLVGGAMAIGFSGAKTADLTPDEPTRMMALVVTPGHPAAAPVAPHR